MPKRTDIETIFIIGSGPIVIGQACEFDYSGTQACKTLLAEGYRVVLVNSNPATIMTDPEFATRTYIEPLRADILEKIIAKEKPDALLPTLGGQTGLNLAVELFDSGVLDKYGVEMIGARGEVIKKAEDRELFKAAMQRIGLYVPTSATARNLEEAMAVADEIGSFPLIIRPAFTLGGTGGGIAEDAAAFELAARKGLGLSPIHEILIEESVVGWKEYELEVMRDLNDNVVIVCPIENFDPMGIHTGDSITVAPAQTLTDKEYQVLRDASIAVMREIGVETGGSNIQFAVHPDTGKVAIIEMNPRVSRSSALASKATGFPIAKIAALLAVGYTLDEIPNDITRETMASFEPSIDYCVVKCPRWAFEKFPGADPTLTIQMKSVGEAMSIGRTFKEALQKGLRSLETGRYGLGADGEDPDLESLTTDEIDRKLRVPNLERIFYLKYALQKGYTHERIFELTKIDPWYIENIQEIIEIEQLVVANRERLLAAVKEGALAKAGGGGSNDGDTAFARETIRTAKRAGFSDIQLACLLGLGPDGEDDVRRGREALGIEPVFKLVDTCAAEFEAYTPYYYSTYEREDECRRTDRKKIMILGGGPNRIGQGIEFDYCCVHASFALKADGYETIMVNCNPETVSTDYDTSDKLYFEPLTKEDVLAIYRRERCDGVIVQFGGQTPLNLAESLEAEGVNIIGTSPDSIARAEDRERFKVLLEKLGLRQPPNGTATSTEGAKQVAADIGYPVVIRPSFVLGGRAMEIVNNEAALVEYMTHAVKASRKHPVLIDKFLENAVEVDIDAVADGTRCVVAAIMEHIEEAGIHSGDSACSIPPYSLRDEIIDELKQVTYALAKELGVVGLMNIQCAVRGRDIFILEVNPRASRTVPFVSKAKGIPFAKVAARVMAGKTLDELGLTTEVDIDHFAVKEAIFPFGRFPGVDIILGPEMKSTGEVMGLDRDFGLAYAKTQFGSGGRFPTSGNAFISVRDEDKRNVIFIAKKMEQLGFQIYSTPGTAKTLRNFGIEVVALNKLQEGHPNVLDMMRRGEVDIIVNTPAGRVTRQDEVVIRSTATHLGIPCYTTVSGAATAVNAMEAYRAFPIEVRAIQDYHAREKS
jgi:carbamoyl-phosphate synthase large subunit